ncbi:unnamed protein product, partial [Porites lobata]
MTGPLDRFKVPMCINYTSIVSEKKHHLKHVDKRRRRNRDLPRSVLATCRSVTFQIDCNSVLYIMNNIELDLELEEEGGGRAEKKNKKKEQQQQKKIKKKKMEEEEQKKKKKNKKRSSSGKRRSRRWRRKGGQKKRKKNKNRNKKNNTKMFLVD